MKTISLALAAIIATTALVPAASAKSTKKDGNSPFVTYADPYTGEDMTVYRRNYYVPSNDFEGGNFPGNYALRKAEGRCVIDLGYGRWQYCNEALQQHSEPPTDAASRATVAPSVFGFRKRPSGA